jgi:aminoglycoside/choline kinase family phosphotransferase
VNTFLAEMRILMDELSLTDQVPQAWGKTIQSVFKIPGDASTRSYYRVKSGGKSFIAMRMEDFSKQGEKLDFIEMQRHLKSAQVDVPEIIDLDPGRGYILLEDLGDVTLLRRLQEVANSEVERHLYEKVLDSLIRLQVHASPARKPADVGAYHLYFDHTKLMWEMQFTIEHFYELHLKRTIGPNDRKTMVDGLSGICTQLAAQPTVLSHRDFHSRNIMVSGERVVMIDFQDARLGPAQYDLVSVLKDSYYQLEETQIRALLNYYLKKYQEESGTTMSQTQKDEFNYYFDLMSVQRNFKAIGSFASFLNRRGNATYLKYIGNTFENIRRTLLKYPELSPLREVLFHYYYF